MKKVTLILVMALMGLVSYAQEDAVPVVKYGYLSYDTVFAGLGGLAPACAISKDQQVSLEPDSDGCYTLVY